MAAAKVLVVDDHAIVRRTVCGLIRRDSTVEVICESATGEDAVTKAQELQPDLVLLDISLPGISGIEAARQIKKVSDHLSQPTRFIAHGYGGIQGRWSRIRYEEGCCPRPY